MSDAETTRIETGEQYIESLRGRNVRVFLAGEQIAEPVDHPIVRPSINAVAETYDLAAREPALASVESPISGRRVNRFLHIARSPEDLVLQNKMQRRLGQLTGTCFQRCVGMDAFNALHSVTFDVDAAKGTDYHARLLAFLKAMQEANYVVGGAMTDVKGDRSKAPHAQADQDLFVRVVERREDGVVLRGAKAHQTGCINSHFIVCMPTMRLGEADRDFAIVAAFPTDAEGVTFVYGRQSCDARALEGGSDIDQGNATFSGQEALILLDDVFVPYERVFLDGEVEFAAPLVERFTCYHRRSYVCKTGVGDVLIGAAAQAASDNGVSRASHIRDKLVEMTHLNETIYGTGIASSQQATRMASGVYLNDELLANVCKHHVTRFPFELGRLAQDLAGGLVSTAPHAADLAHPEIGPLLDKYLRARADVPTEARLRILRLIENMTMGRNAVGYLTESLHGAGSPEAQRIQIKRQMQLEEKQALARVLAGVDDPATRAALSALEGYLGRVFDTGA